ncbi:MAG: hypothetical protein U0N57_06350 [Collinsella sp.]
MPNISTTPWAHRSPRPSAYGSLKAYGDPNRRSEERNAWIEYLATESDDSILGPEEVDIHE